MTELAKQTLAETWGMTDSQLEVVRRQCVGEGAPDDILELYLQRCKSLGADPFGKLLYVVKRQKNVKDNFGNWHKEDVWTFQSGIDLFRSIADSHGDEYAGQIGPLWTSDGKEWVDVWLSDKAPAACKIGILRKSFSEPMWVTGTYAYYCPKDKDGTPRPTDFWKGEKAAHQLAKCVEALGLRKAFPQKLRGLYAGEEMEQAQERKAITPRSQAPALNAAPDAIDVDFQDDHSEPVPAPQRAPKPQGGQSVVLDSTAHSGAEEGVKTATPAELLQARSMINALVTDDAILLPLEIEETIVSVLGPDLALDKVTDLDSLRAVYKALADKKKAASTEVPM